MSYLLSTINLIQLTDIARNSVAVGHNVLVQHTDFTVTLKSDRDLVTDIEFLIQKAVKQYLYKETPRIPFRSEEGFNGKNLEEDEFSWILDPIDGTSNFVHGLELYGIQLALLHYGKPVVGVIDAPRLNKTYWGTLREGAWCNGEKITVSAVEQLPDAIINLGDYAVGENSQEKNTPRFTAKQSLANKAHRIRILGTAALDFAFLSEGHTDAIIMHCNNPWDVAAGKIIAKEAGATITTLTGEPHDLRSTSILASTPKIHTQIIETIKPT